MIEDYKLTIKYFRKITGCHLSSVGLDRFITSCFKRYPVNLVMFFQLKIIFSCYDKYNSVMYLAIITIMTACASEVICIIYKVTDIYTI